MTVTNPTTERDPVCGMNVNPSTAKNIHEHAGKAYYFCCPGCVEKFKANPQVYLTKPSSNLVMLGMAAKPAPHPRGVAPLPDREKRRPEAESPISYVCPMCPQVHESKPGACPSCGMAL